MKTLLGMILTGVGSYLSLKYDSTIGFVVFSIGNAML